MSYIVFAVLLALVGIALLVFVRTDDGKLNRFCRIIGGVLVGVVLPLFTIWNAVYQVPAGHAGLMYRFTDIVGQTGEGLQWTAPWQNIVNASIRVQKYPFPKLDSFSKETQNVYVTATANLRVSPGAIQNLYRTVGADYFNVVVAPRVNQAFKDETVKYSAVDIAPNRENIRRSVRTRLTKELEAFSITMDDLLIDNITFDSDFQRAIEDKQVQTQKALAEEEKVAVAKYQADQQIEAARGRAESTLVEAIKQAEANRELAASLSPELIQYLTVQKLAPGVKVMLIPTGQQFILGADMLRLEENAPRAK